MSHAWMPLNVDDYLSDTHHLSATEHGAYLLLIMLYWKDGGLPEDERMIARHAKLSPEQWGESRDVLAAFFHDGWKHARIDSELARAAEVIEQRRAAGSNAAKKRWANRPDAPRMPGASVPDNETMHTNQEQISASLRSADTGAKRAARLPADWVLPDGWGKDAIDAGLPADAIDLEASKMRDWSLSSPNGACKDWHARWRNWCREAAQRLPRSRAGPAKPKTAADFLLAETMGKLDEHIRHDGPQTGDRRDAGEFSGVTVAGTTRRLGLHGSG